MMLFCAKQLIKTVFDPLLWRLSRGEFLSLLEQHSEARADEIFAIARDYRGEGWYRTLYPMQVESEYLRLIDWAVATRPKIVMEIGTSRGGTLLPWARIATELVISVDLQNGIHGGGYPPPKKKLFNLFLTGRPGIEMVLIQADSQNAATLEQVKKRLAGRKLNILFIDGNHRLDGVTRDFELWSPLVHSGGHVVFHDIVKHPRDDCNVDILWDRLKPAYHHQEIIEDRDQGKCGIGILDLP